MSAFPFELDIQYSRKRRTIAIMIKQGQVKVRAPHYADEDQVMQFVSQKQDWIADKLKYSQQSLNQACSYDLNGGTISLLGQPIDVEVYSATVTRQRFANHTLSIDLSKRIKPENKLPNLHKQIAAFYQQQATEYLIGRSQYWSNQTQLYPKSVAIKTFTARWGSCDRFGNIQLNWKLMRLEAPMIDYVIVHELCHLKHFNHSSAFWNLVRHHYPHTDSCRAWFKRYGNDFLS